MTIKQIKLKITGNPRLMQFQLVLFHYSVHLKLLPDFTDHSASFTTVLSGIIVVYHMLYNINILKILC